jgi:hypothetical protein
MSRSLSERLATAQTPRSFLSFAAGLVSVAALTACGGATTSTADDTTTAAALSEAKSSAEDTRAAAKACFTTFETCRAAASADIVACKTALGECLPTEAGKGPHCGPPPGKGPRGPKGGGGGDCDGGRRDPGSDPDPRADGDPNGPPPPPRGPGDDADEGPSKGDPRPAGDPSDAPPGPRDPGEGEGEGEDVDGRGGDGPRDGADRGPGGERPDYCDHVPLPAPPEVQACNAALDVCVKGAGADDACFVTHDACVRAAFDAALPPAVR